MLERVIPFTHVLLKWVIGYPIRFLFFRVEVRGLENVPTVGPGILVANHMSNLDPGVIGTTINRRIRFMAKKELFFPGFGQLLKLHGVFSVRRLEGDRGALRKAESILAAGELLGMFPEGTRSRTGQMHEGHGGTAFIALRSGAPIIPVAITGTENIKTIKNTLLTRPRLTVTYGAPFYLERPAKVSSAAVAEATNVIMRKVAELLPAAYRGVYAEGESAPPATAESAATVATPGKG